MSIFIQGRTSNVSGYNSDYAVFSVTFEKITNFFRPIEFFLKIIFHFQEVFKKIENYSLFSLEKTESSFRNKFSNNFLSFFRLDIFKLKIDYVNYISDENSNIFMTEIMEVHEIAVLFSDIEMLKENE